MSKKKFVYSRKQLDQQPKKYNINISFILNLQIGNSISEVTKPVRAVGEKIKGYVPDITESEIAKKVSKSVSDAEVKIMDNTNIYQYGGFKSKADRNKLKEKLSKNADTSDSSEKSNTEENEKYLSPIIS